MSINCVSKGMNYSYDGCIVFIIRIYQKVGVVEIARDRDNHLENNSFMIIHKRA